MNFFRGIVALILVYLLSSCGGGGQTDESDTNIDSSQMSRRATTLALESGTSTLDQTATGFFYPITMVST